MMRILIAAMAVVMLGARAWGLDIGGLELEGPEQVSVSMSEWAWRMGDERIPQPVVSVSLNSGRSMYQIRHDRKYGSGRMGLSRPTGANWHESEMLDIRINGERFDFLPEHDEKVEIAEGDVGKAMFSWENEAAKLRLNFYMFALDDKIFLEVLLEPRVDIDRLGITFRGFPGSTNRDPRHVFYTPERRLEETGTVNLGLPGENWVLLTDENMNYGEHDRAVGPCGIAYLPEGISSARISMGGFGSNLSLTCDPGARRFVFTLWEFPDMTNSEAAGAMEGRIAAAFEKMNMLRKGGL